jgi:hypothetical protein
MTVSNGTSVLVLPTSAPCEYTDGLVRRKNVCREFVTKLLVDPSGSGKGTPANDQNVSVSRARSVAAIALTPSAITRL